MDQLNDGPLRLDAKIVKKMHIRMNSNVRRFHQNEARSIDTEACRVDKRMGVDTKRRQIEKLRDK